MSLTTDQFAKALIAAGLASVDEVKQLWAALPAGERPKNGEAFASLLVQRKQLNDFQAQTLLSGSTAPLVLGDYLLVGRIGAGGMGQVFQARHRHMKRIVAIKVLPPALTQDEAAIKRFQREVEAAAHLVHPNIVQAYDASVQRGVWYLVMEYVAGRDLASVSADGPAPVDRAIDYIRQAAKGLAFAHSRGVVHRDIKPANLLLDSEGCVKILDMGLARFENEIAAKDGLTQSGMVMGTIDYMAPEQAFDTHTADARADMYSLGCTLYRLLTQRNLYDADTIIKKLTAHQSKPIPSLLAVRKDVPPGLASVFEKMVAKQPEDRFQSMQELIAALDKLEGKPSGGAKQLGGGSSGSGGVNAAVQTPPKLEVAPTIAMQNPQQATDPVSERSIQAARLSPTTSVAKRKPPRNRTLILGGAGVAAVVMLLGGWFILPGLLKDSSAHVHVPPNGSATVVSAGAPSELAPIDFAAERKAAEWVLSAGGSITLEDQEGRPIADFGAVPPNQDFTLAGFDLTGRSELATDELRQLSFCRRLKTIVFTGTPVDDEDVAAVGLRPPLITLRLNRTKVTDKSILAAADTATLLNIALEETATSDLGVEALTRHSRLAHISLGSAKITPDAIQRCAAANRSLWRFEVSQFPQEALSGIEDHPSLQMIDCPPHQLTPAAVRTLNRCSKVDHLHVFSIGKPFPAETFERIVQLERIRALDFTQPAASESIAAAQFLKLKSIATLRELSVGAGLDDAGLSAIGNITTLTKLSLGEHRCTPTAVEAFGKARPDVQLTIGGVQYPATAAALPPIDFAAERKAAQWVLAAQGNVILEDEAGQRFPLENGLPAGKFVVAEVALDGISGAKFTKSDLELLAGCARLRRLAITHIDVTDRDLGVVPLREPLTHLHLDNTPVSNETLTRAGQVSTLREVSLRKTMMSDRGLAALAKQGQITTVYLDAPGITRGIQEFVAGNPNLHTLWFADSPDENALHGSAPRLKLTHVQCTPRHLTPVAVDWLNRCPQLESLDCIARGVYPEATFDQFSRLENLRSLTLGQMGAPTPIDARLLRKLRTLPKLTEMRISDGGCDDECLRALAEFSALARLVVPPNPNRCTAEGIEAFRKARPDVHLTVDDKDYPATATVLPPIDFVAERTAAEWVLSAKGQVEIVDANGNRLELTGGKLPAGDFQLAEVSFEPSAELADADLSRLTACRRLRVVTLKHPSLTDRGIEVLKLRPPLSGLHLHGPGFSDATAASAAKVASLRHITLWDSTVTDRGLADLAAHGRLTSLSWGSREATAAGLAKLVAGNPQLAGLTLGPASPARLLEDLSAHPSLQIVVCAAFQFTDPAVDALNSCPQMSVLSVSSDAQPYSASDFDRFARLKGIRKIALAHTGQATPLEARQLRKLAEVKTLSTIELWAGCNDECLRALRENPSLTSLIIPTKYHHCTADGIDEFRQARPEVHLSIDGKEYPATAAPKSP